jgi:hypothetical protein
MRLAVYPKLVVLLYLVLLAPVVHGQTSIVAARGPNEVVIGADSKRKISEFEPTGRLVGVTSTLACKIQKADGFYFGCSGPCGELDVASIIVRASRGPASIQSKVEGLVPLVEDALNNFLENKSPNALRLYVNKPTALQLLFVGIQNRVPLIIGVDFHYRKSESGVSVKAGEIRVCGATSDACTHLVIGRTDAISNFSKKKGSMDYLARVPPVVGVERLIQMEIDEEPDDVGPPIDILRVTKRGATWIRRKRQCMEVSTSRAKTIRLNAPLLGVRRPVAAFACTGLSARRRNKSSIESALNSSADQSGDRSPHSKERLVLKTDLSTTNPSSLTQSLAGTYSFPLDLQPFSNPSTGRSGNLR